MTSDEATWNGTKWSRWSACALLESAFGGPEENQTLMAIEASCIDEVAQRAGASFGEVAE